MGAFLDLATKYGNPDGAFMRLAPKYSNNNVPIAQPIAPIAKIQQTPEQMLGINKQPNPNPLVRIQQQQQDYLKQPKFMNIVNSKPRTPEQIKQDDEQVYNDTPLNDKFRQGKARPLDYAQAGLENIGKVLNIPAVVARAAVIGTVQGITGGKWGGSNAYEDPTSPNGNQGYSARKFLADLTGIDIIGNAEKVNPILGMVLDLGAEILSDPLTYVGGIGIVGKVGKVGKALEAIDKALNVAKSVNKASKLTRDIETVSKAVKASMVAAEEASNVEKARKSLNDLKLSGEFKAGQAGSQAFIKAMTKNAEKGMVGITSKAVEDINPFVNTVKTKAENRVIFENAKSVKPIEKVLPIEKIPKPYDMVKEYINSPVAESIANNGKNKSLNKIPLALPIGKQIAPDINTVSKKAISETIKTEIKPLSLNERLAQDKSKGTNLFTTYKNLLIENGYGKDELAYKIRDMQKEFKPINDNPNLTPAEMSNMKNEVIINNMKNDTRINKPIAQPMQTASSFGINTVGGAESQFKYETKTSKFADNTLKNGFIFNTEQKAKIKPIDYQYVPISEQQSLKIAEERIQVDLVGEIKELSNKTITSSEDVDTTILAIDSLLYNGNEAKALELTKHLQEELTRAGQEIQAVAKWSRNTPAGKLVEAQKEVANAEKTILEKSPKLKNKINDEVKKTKEVINTATKDAVDETIKELSPGELLAKKIGNTLSDNVTKNNNPITDMVNELFKSAKESPLPERVAQVQRNPIDFLKQAIQNKEQYTDVWENAKNILRQKYANSPDELSMLEDYFNKGIIPTYSSKTLNSSVKTAMNDLGQKVIDIVKTSKGNKKQILKDLTDYLIAKTGATADDAALLANKIQSRYTKLLKTKSQQILSNMTKPTIKGITTKKPFIDKITELINLGAFDDVSIANAIKEKYGIPVLNNDDIKNIFKYMKKAEKGIDSDVWIAKANQLIARKVPTSLNDRFRGLANISLLGNLITNQVNITSNALLQGVNNASNVIGTPLDKLISLKSGVRTTTLPSVATQAKGYAKGIKEGLRDSFGGLQLSELKGLSLKDKAKKISEGFANPINTNGVDVTKFSDAKDLAFKNNFMRIVENAVYTPLTVMDRAVSTSVYDETLRQLVKTNKVTTPTQEMIDIAKEVSNQIVLKDKNSISEIFKAIQNLPKSISNPVAKNVTQFLVDNLLIRFAQVPGSILRRGIELSPVGLIEGITKGIYSGAKGTMTMAKQKEVVDLISRSIVGTTLIFGSYQLFTNASSSVYNSDTYALDTATGKQIGSIKIGNKYYNYDRFAPLSMAIAAGAALRDVKTMGDLQGFLDAGANAINMYASLPLLQNISSLLGRTNSESSGVAQNMVTSLLKNVVQQYIPTPLRQFAQTIDPYVRETKSSDQITNDFINPIKAKIPFLNQTLPIKKDVFGGNVKNFDGTTGIEKVVNAFANPMKITTEKYKDISSEIDRVYAITHDRQAIPQFPKDNFSRDNIKYQLSDTEFNKFKEDRGKAVLSGLIDLFKTPDYKNATADVKAEKINKKMDEVTTKLKTVFVNSPQGKKQKQTQENLAKINAIRKK